MYDSIFTDQEKQNIKNEKIKLPEESKLIKSVWNEAKRLYSEFDKRGKFYDSYTVYEFGRRYTFIEETDGSGEPYETVADWLEEITGNMGPWFVPETYEDLLREFAEEEVIESLRRLNTHIDEYEILEIVPYFIIASELVEIIGEKDINELIDEKA